MSAAGCNSMVVDYLKQKGMNAKIEHKLSICSHPSLLNNIHCCHCVFMISCKIQILFSFHYFESH